MSLQGYKNILNNLFTCDKMKKNRERRFFMENYNDIPVVTAEPEKEGGKGFAIASLVLSICSFLPCCLPYIGGFISLPNIL